MEKNLENKMETGTIMGHVRDTLGLYRNNGRENGPSTAQLLCQKIRRAY